ncbi:hypothetical protein ACFE04_024884 [Oxalis oulophora]
MDSLLALIKASIPQPWHSSPDKLACIVILVLLLISLIVVCCFKRNKYRAHADSELDGNADLNGMPMQNHVVELGSPTQNNEVEALSDIVSTDPPARRHPRLFEKRIVLYSTDDESNTEEDCAICLEEFEEGASFNLKISRLWWW